MKIVVFGLSISSAWGNGHATLLRGLFRALHAKKHEVHFFERDTSYYAAHRDVTSLPFADLHFYSDWLENLPLAISTLSDADVGVVTSYCPDGLAASELLRQYAAGMRTIFYDMDTPVTLSRLEKGETIPYLPVEGLGAFDLVLSYTGGVALEKLKSDLNARRVAPFYGWVDPQVYFSASSSPHFDADLSYLGTYAADRQQALQTLLIDPAKRLPNKTFVIGGAMYQNPETWPSNIRHFSHVSPPEHSAFYCSSPLTLNVTRGAMGAMGYCPSGRLFEAAACGTAVLSDWWEGLDTFFEPGREILIASSTSEATSAIQQDCSTLRAVGRKAKQRALECHTADIRARQFINLVESPGEELRAETTPADIQSRSLTSRDA